MGEGMRRAYSTPQPRRVTVCAQITRVYDCLVTVDFTPGYPPPPAHDHDDPAFSDPGCDDEIEFVSAEGDCCELPPGFELTGEELSDLRDAAAEAWGAKEPDPEYYRGDRRGEY